MKMDLEIKQKAKARFAFLPRLIEIAKEGRIQIAEMVEIGKSLGFDRNLTEQIERYLISEKLITPSKHGGIISINGMGEVAFSSLGRHVTEIKNETIFAVFNNPELMAEIECWAGENGSQITIGESPPDIVAIPFFACVIDRRVLGQNAWDLYLEYMKKEDESISPTFNPCCIIVDNLRNSIYLPEYGPVFFCDLIEKNSIQWILKSIEIAKQIVDEV